MFARQLVRERKDRWVPDRVKVCLLCGTSFETTHESCDEDGS